MIDLNIIDKLIEDGEAGKIDPPKIDKTKVLNTSLLDPTTGTEAKMANIGAAEVSCLDLANVYDATAFGNPKDENEDPCFNMEEDITPFRSFLGIDPNEFIAYDSITLSGIPLRWNETNIENVMVRIILNTKDGIIFSSLKNTSNMNNFGSKEFWDCCLNRNESIEKLYSVLRRCTPDPLIAILDDQSCVGLTEAFNSSSFFTPKRILTPEFLISNPLATPFEHKPARYLDQKSQGFQLFNKDGSFVVPGEIYISIRGNEMPSSSDLENYIRQVGKFSAISTESQVIEAIYHAIAFHIKPERLMVAGIFGSHHGVMTCPIRASHHDMIPDPFVNPVSRFKLPVFI